MSKLKVYGWRSHRAECPPAPNGSHQTREIMAANSVAEVLRATGMTRSTWNSEGLGETGNPMEIAVAMADPGNIYWKPYNDNNDTWTGPPGAPTIEPMTRTRLRLDAASKTTNWAEQAAASLLAAVDAVLALHVEVPGFRGCNGCHSDDDAGYIALEDCPTRRAIEDHTRGMP